MKNITWFVVLLILSLFLIPVFQSVNALSVVANIPVNNNPEDIAYDSVKGEMFVTNAVANTVSVISDETNTVVNTITVGINPKGIAYDSAKGEMFVGSSGTGYVSMISDATNTVVNSTHLYRSLTVSMAYDPAKGEMFVASDIGDVSVISDATNTVVNTIPVPAPDGIAYDSAKGEMFTTNFIGSVSVISDATNTVVDTIPVGSRADGIAYDSAKGEMFVTNAVANTVSVISDETNTVVATISGLNYPRGIAYDSAKGEIFVANNIGSISVISDATNTVVYTIPVGGAKGIAYDSVKGEMFATNGGSNTVYVINDGTSSTLAIPSTTSSTLTNNVIQFDIGSWYESSDIPGTISIENNNLSVFSNQALKDVFATHTVTPISDFTVSTDFTVQSDSASTTNVSLVVGSSSDQNPIPNKTENYLFFWYDGGLGEWRISFPGNVNYFSVKTTTIPIGTTVNMKITRVGDNWSIYANHQLITTFTKSFPQITYTSIGCGNGSSSQGIHCHFNNIVFSSDSTNTSILPTTTSVSIPSWIKNNAKYWSQGQVGDSDFIQGIQYLIQQGIMKIPQTQSSSSSSNQIPSWVKSNAGFWATGQISDDDFVKGIQYMVSNGIISSSSLSNQPTSTTTFQNNISPLVITSYSVGYLDAPAVKAVPKANAPPSCEPYASTTGIIQNGCVDFVSTTIQKKYATVGETFPIIIHVDNRSPNQVQIPTQLAPRVIYSQKAMPLSSSSIVPNNNMETVVTSQVFPPNDAQGNSLATKIICNLSSTSAGYLSPNSKDNVLSYSCTTQPWSYINTITWDKLVKDNFIGVTVGTLTKDLPLLDNVDTMMLLGEQSYAFLLTGDYEQTMRVLVDHGYFTAGVSYSLGLQEVGMTENSASESIPVVVFAPQEIVDAAENVEACHLSVNLGSTAFTIATVGIDIPAEISGATIAGESLTQSLCDMSSQKLMNGY